MPQSLLSPKFNYYTLLNLPLPSEKQQQLLSKDVIKAAYHRALLTHHPDKQTSRHKNNNPAALKQGKDDIQLIDLITEAYRILSEPKSREAYDKKLLLAEISLSHARRGDSLVDSYLGVEELDLGDFYYDEKTDSWSGRCRCGLENGYIVTAVDLEAAISERQVLVGCQGCSLYVKVMFDADGKV